MWGLVRAAQTENPGRIVLVDAIGDLDVATVLAVGEPQLVLRDGGLLAARVVGSRGAGSVLEPPTTGKPWRLGIATAGTFDDLELQEVPNSGEPVRAGHIRVEMNAVAANFRDVMITLGMFTHDALLGSEGAGVVAEIGDGVTDFAVGDRVMGLFPEGTGTVVQADARLVAPIPSGWTDAEAAATLVVFTTAYYGLRELADVQPGQSILIHAATGGVGLAAVQLARHWGHGRVHVRQQAQVGHVARHGLRRRPHRRFAHPGLRAEVHDRDRRSRLRRGARLAGRRLRRRVAAPAPPRRVLPGDGQDRHP